MADDAIKRLDSALVNVLGQSVNKLAQPRKKEFFLRRCCKDDVSFNNDAVAWSFVMPARFPPQFVDAIKIVARLDQDTFGKLLEGFSNDPSILSSVVDKEELELITDLAGSLKSAQEELPVHSNAVGEFVIDSIKGIDDFKDLAENDFRLLSDRLSRMVFAFEDISSKFVQSHSTLGEPFQDVRRFADSYRPPACIRKEH